MAGKFRYPVEIYERIAEQYAKGENCTSLSRQYSFSPTHILRIVRSLKVPVRTVGESLLGKRAPKRLFGDVQELRICALYKTGKTLREIAFKYQCFPNISAISNVLKRYKIKTRKNLRNGKEGKYTSRWKGGVSYDRKGHRKLQVPNYPNCNVGGWIYEHRYVMERHLGRFLDELEVVHHINGIPDDNRIENLEIMTHSEHSRLHALGRRR
jgi:Mor family transcriptional regulator